MANFLELCQSVARESGTVTGGQPTAVVGQTGRLLKIVKFTALAWRKIQLMRTDWHWMNREFAYDTIINTEAYTSASWGMKDLGSWLDTSPLFCTKQGETAQFQRALTYVPWKEFRASHRRAYNEPGTPAFWSVRPGDNALMLAPKPDGVYKLEGEYRKAVQTLSNDTDTPEFHTDHHDIIVWRALLLLNEHDEAGDAAATAAKEYSEMLSSLMDRELDNPSFGGPLA